MLFNLILLMLTITYLKWPTQHLHKVGSGVVGVDVGWCPGEVTHGVVLQDHQYNVIAWMKPHLSSLSLLYLYLLVSFSYTPRWVTVNRTARIITLIQGLMPYYYLVICLFVRSSALRWRADGESGVGWPEKSSYTVHFPAVLISMSTVRAPPMSHLGVRRGEEQEQS